jgi:hypothetical protein
MSSDPTRPQPPPEWNPDAPTQQYPAGKPRPTFTPNDQYQPPPEQRPEQRYDPPTQQYDQQQYDQQQYDQQQYVGTPPGRASRQRRKRRRWPIVTGIFVIVLLLLAVAADRFACYEAENTMADKIQQNGLPVKPHVSIEGFPFLTQLAAKDFNDVVISASNVTEGSLTIASINATLHGMHLIDGYSGARIDTLNGTALITFGALATAGDIPSDIKLGPGADSNEIKASVDVPLLGNQSVTAQVTKTSASQFDVAVVNADGIESSILGNLANFKVNVPQLPAGMNIRSVAVTQQGVLITITGQNTTLTQS